MDSYTYFDTLPTFPCDLTNKEELTSQFIKSMLNRTHAMFKCTSATETDVPLNMLETMLQVNGHVAFFKHNNKLFFSRGSFANIPDEYYRPTEYIVTNPYIKGASTLHLKINENCVIVRNDTMLMGLMPLLRKYATQLTENTISIHVADINSRIVAIINALTDSDKKSAESYIKAVSDGRLSVVGSSVFTNGVQVQPYALSGHGALTDLIELQQYLKASLYNELGLNANFNMKRESISSGESGLNEDALFPLVDDMLRCRQDDIKKVNVMFNTDFSYSRDSSWGIHYDEVVANSEHAEGTYNENN